MVFNVNKQWVLHNFYCKSTLNKYDPFLSEKVWAGGRDLGIVFYRPPMKLREGSVFSRVCRSVCPEEGGPRVTITYDVLELTIRKPPGRPPIQWNPSPSPVQGPPPGGTHGMLSCVSLYTNRWWGHSNLARRSQDIKFFISKPGSAAAVEHAMTSKKADFFVFVGMIT